MAQVGAAFLVCARAGHPSCELAGSAPEAPEAAPPLGQMTEAWPPSHTAP